MLLFPWEQEPKSNMYTLHSEVGFTRSKRRKCLWFSKFVLSLIALPIQEFCMIFFPHFLYVECGAGYTYRCLIPHQLLPHLKSPFLRNLHFSMRARQQIKNTLENISHIKKIKQKGNFHLERKRGIQGSKWSHWNIHPAKTLRSTGLGIQNYLQQSGTLLWKSIYLLRLH